MNKGKSRQEIEKERVGTQKRLGRMVGKKKKTFHNPVPTDKSIHELHSGTERVKFVIKQERGSEENLCKPGMIRHINRRIGAKQNFVNMELEQQYINKGKFLYNAVHFIITGVGKL
jgi:hypothetical protein